MRKVFIIFICVAGVCGCQTSRKQGRGMSEKSALISVTALDKAVTDQNVQAALEHSARLAQGGKEAVDAIWLKLYQTQNKKLHRELALSLKGNTTKRSSAVLGQIILNDRFSHIADLALEEIAKRKFGLPIEEKGTDRLVFFMQHKNLSIRRHGAQILCVSMDIEPDEATLGKIIHQANSGKSSVQTVVTTLKAVQRESEPRRIEKYSVQKPTPEPDN